MIAPSAREAPPAFGVAVGRGATTEAEVALVERARAYLAAIEQSPEQGRLYRDLAVEVYAARGDFASALACPVIQICPPRAPETRPSSGGLQ